MAGLRKVGDLGMGFIETSRVWNMPRGLVSWMWKEEWGPVQLEGPFAGHSQS